MLRVQQFPGQDGLLGEFIRIEGSNALLGGAKFLVGQSCVLQAVQLPVLGHQQGGPVADF